jgi:hypothetical protein
MPVPACGSRCAGEGPSSEAEPARGGVSPRARRSPLEGGVSPRARRNPLEGAFNWATPVGRRGHRSVDRALCACLGKRCVLLSFFPGFKQGSPGFLGDPQGCPRQLPRFDSSSSLHLLWLNLIYALEMEKIRNFNFQVGRAKR